jgi:peptidoglycan hydrolase CwlO-like protein
MLKRIHITALLLLLLPAGVLASPQDDLNRLNGEIDSLKDKLATQQQVSTSLQAKIGALQTQIALTRAELGKTRAERAVLESKINDLNIRIAQAEAEIAEKKLLARKLIRVDYITGSASTAEILLGSSSFSDFYARATYAQNVRYRLELLVARLDALKAQLAADRVGLETSHREVSALEAKQASQEAELAGQQAEERRLLAQSKAAERELAVQIGRRAGEAEAIKDAIHRINSSPAEQQKKQQATVPPGERSGVPQYYQTDSRWGSNPMNGTSSTIRDFGCGITSIAMVLGYYGLARTPAQIAADYRYFWGSTDLIQWSGTDRGISVATEGQFEWTRLARSQIFSYVQAGAPVLVWIDGAFGANTRHFVVLTGALDGGDYVMNDPVRGPNLRFGAFYSTGQIVQVDLITPS